MGFLDDIENLTIEEKFHKWLPDTLMKDHYTLAKDYGHTPQEWRTFLRDNHLFIESELSAIAEAEARSALSRLGNASGQEVTALKAILEKSKLINDAQRQSTKVVLTFIPHDESQLKKEEPKHDNMGQNHFSSPSRQPSSDSRPAPPSGPKPIEPPMSQALSSILDEKPPELPEPPKRKIKYR